MGCEPVACELLVEGWLAVTNFVAFYRPETGAVRGKHLITDNDVAVLIEAELKFGISNDDSMTVSIVCAFFVKRDGAVAKLCSVLCTLAREVFLQVINALFLGDVFVVVTDLCFCGRSIDRLRQFLGFL